MNNNIFKSKSIFALIAIIIEVTLIISLSLYFSIRYLYFLIISQIISRIVLVRILSRRINLNFKLSLSLLVLLFPIIGTTLYLIYNKTKSNKYKKNYRDALLKDCSFSLFDAIDKIDSYLLNNKINRYCDTQIEILDECRFFDDLIKRIKKAKKYIILEYFIVRDGKLLDLLLQAIGESKCSERYMLVDGVGSLNSLSKKTLKKIKDLNIKFKVFNEIKFNLNGMYNYRNHRKIAIIDSVCYLGGCNISDEYCNLTSFYGKWCDLNLLIKGSIVNEFYHSFKKMYQIDLSSLNEMELSLEYNVKENDIRNGRSYLINQNPLYKELLNHDLILNLLNEANSIVNIISPYLIIDDEILNTLKRLSLSGVEVNIIVPHTPDKKIIFYYTKTYYNDLLQYNCHIYEYLPGFIHAKLIIIDDKYALSGTCNLDYRSIYLHFESMLLLCECAEIKDLRTFFDNVKEQCKIIEFRKQNILTRVFNSLIRLISPLL